MWRSSAAFVGDCPRSPLGREEGVHLADRLWEDLERAPALQLLHVLGDSKLKRSSMRVPPWCSVSRTWIEVVGIAEFGVPSGLAKPSVNSSDLGGAVSPAGMDA